MKTKRYVATVLFLSSFLTYATWADEVVTEGEPALSVAENDGINDESFDGDGVEENEVLDFDAIESEDESTELDANGRPGGRPGGGMGRPGGGGGRPGGGMGRPGGGVGRPGGGGGRPGGGVGRPSYPGRPGGGVGRPSYPSRPGGGVGRPSYPGRPGGGVGRPTYPGRPGYPGRPNYPGRPGHRPPGFTHPPYPIHGGYRPWPRWNRPYFPRPIYNWDWQRIRVVTCNSEDSSGNQYPVTETTQSGYWFQQRVSEIQDASLDRCYYETGGDTGCTLLGCTSSY